MHPRDLETMASVVVGLWSCQLSTQSGFIQEWKFVKFHTTNFAHLGDATQESIKMQEDQKQAKCFGIGSEVKVRKTGEHGVIARPCDRPEWDWFVQFSKGSPVPYLEAELDHL